MPEPPPLNSEDTRMSRWVVARTAPDQLTAEFWRGLLEAEGIPATLGPEDAVSFLGVTGTPCRVLVPEALVDRAVSVLDVDPEVVERSE